MASDFRMPGDSHRIAVIGRTGSGKTVQAAWFLSHADMETRPWVMIDYKGDELLNSIPWVNEVGYKDKLGKNGLYILHPNPGEDEEVEKYLMDIWARENTGIMIDEGYMVPNKNALRTIMTQGRSKKLPAIVLSQRPSFISQFIFSEADFFSVFNLNTLNDRKRVNEYFQVDLKTRLPDYHSHYYDVGKDKRFVLKPAPKDEVILDKFHQKLKPRRIML